jgi:hypothetical protein
LQRAWVKYGAQNFKFEILSQVPENELALSEESWMKYYMSADPIFGYNLTQIIGGRNKHPQVVVEKIKRSLIGNKHAAGHVCSQENKLRLHDIRLGSKHTLESRRKMSKNLIGNKRTLGYKHSPETVAKYRHHGYKHTEETKQKLRAARLAYIARQENPGKPGQESQESQG